MSRARRPDADRARRPGSRGEFAMKLRNSLVPISLALAASLWFGGALADDKIVKIGVLNDQAGLYAAITGAGSTLAAQMAVDDSGLTQKGWPIGLCSGGPQNKLGVGVGIPREGFDG